VAWISVLFIIKCSSGEKCSKENFDTNPTLLWYQIFDVLWYDLIITLTHCFPFSMRKTKCVWKRSLASFQHVLCQWHTHRAYGQQNVLFYSLHLNFPRREILLLSGLLSLRRCSEVFLQLLFNPEEKEDALTSSFCRNANLFDVFSLLLPGIFHKTAQHMLIHVKSCF
jgi:hypothetical protein